MDLWRWRPQEMKEKPTRKEKRRIGGAVTPAPGEIRRPRLHQVSSKIRMRYGPIRHLIYLRNWRSRTGCPSRTRSYSTGHSLWRASQADHRFLQSQLRPADTARGVYSR